jgi:hypothetical protein
MVLGHSITYSIVGRNGRKNIEANYVRKRSGSAQIPLERGI